MMTLKKQNIHTLNTPELKGKGQYQALVLPVFIAFLLTLSFFGCSEHGNGDIEKNRTLTPDERYLVNTYVKIHKIEKNLQNNPEELEKKLLEIKNTTDSTVIRKALDNLEKEPGRWIAVYGRIIELLERDSEQTPPN